MQHEIGGTFPYRTFVPLNFYQIATPLAPFLRHNKHGKWYEHKGITSAMSTRPTVKRQPRSETGEMPAVASERREPPMPTTLPEAAEPGSTTGWMPLVTEGEDRKRFKDDSATASEFVAKR
jgi:hypothetical protein